MLDLPPPDRQDSPVPLSHRDQEILEFERTWWTLPGPKEAAIKERFGVSGARYYQLLHGLLEDPDALAYDPMVIKRLRRMRDRRRKARFEGRQAGPGSQ